MCTARATESGAHSGCDEGNGSLTDELCGVIWAWIPGCLPWIQVSSPLCDSVNYPPIFLRRHLIFCISHPKLVFYFQGRNWLIKKQILEDLEIPHPWGKLENLDYLDSLRLKAVKNPASNNQQDSGSSTHHVEMANQTIIVCNHLERSSYWQQGSARPRGHFHGKLLCGNHAILIGSSSGKEGLIIPADGNVTRETLSC